MSLAKAPIEGQAWTLVDWLEFQALSSEFLFCRINELLRISDENQDAENENIGEQDAINEQILEKANDELQIRIKFLGEHYPFRLNGDGSELLLKDDINPGGYVYLYCLIFSHVKRTEVLLIDPPYSNADRDLMQICSTLAAAGIVHGNAISFGFPRPDHTNFLDALKNSYERMDEGTVVDTVPPGAPQNLKDGEVDVIAWENTPDSAAGRSYMLGQVATGKNWEEKSIVGAIDRFHKTWFTSIPPSIPRPAMFIPFCLDINPGQTLKDVIYYYTYEFGELIYRYRIPTYATEGYKLASDNDNNCYVERYLEIDKVIQYIFNFIDNDL